MTQLDYASPESIKLQPYDVSEESLYGLLIASLIIGLWAVSTLFLCCLDLSQVPNWLLIPAVLWQTFLYTGLFITAHDAMHGVVFLRNRKVNDFVGTLAALLFALFPYKKLLKKHWQHHRHPGTQRDPDFHDSTHKNLIAWYIHFMRGYWSWAQMLGLILIFNAAKTVFHLPDSNLVLFWAIPPILSSMQLFFFGTFLPHREPEGGYTNVHHAQTTPWSAFWSFITCYHFGYHLEHHEHPNVPWWRLPVVHKIRNGMS